MAAVITALVMSLGSPDVATPLAQEPAHRLVFGNSEVQVFDVVYEPGKTTGFHVHDHDLVGITFASAETRVETAGQSGSVRESARPEGEVWFYSPEQPVTHRVTNLGDKPSHYVVFQLPPQSAQTASHPVTATTGRVVFDNESVRVIRFDLAAGQATPDHAHSTGYGIVTGTAGKLADDGRVTPTENASFVRWNSASTHHKLQNVGNRPLQVFEFEIFR